MNGMDTYSGSASSTKKKQVSFVFETRSLANGDKEHFKTIQLSPNDLFLPQRMQLDDNAGFANNKLSVPKSRPLTFSMEPQRLCDMNLNGEKKSTPKEKQMDLSKWVPQRISEMQLGLEKKSSTKKKQFDLSQWVPKRMSELNFDLESPKNKKQGARRKLVLSGQKNIPKGSTVQQNKLVTSKNKFTTAKPRESTSRPSSVISRPSVQVKSRVSGIARLSYDNKVTNRKLSFSKPPKRLTQINEEASFQKPNPPEMPVGVHECKICTKMDELISMFQRYDERISNIESKMSNMESIFATLVTGCDVSAKTNTNNRLLDLTVARDCVSRSLVGDKANSSLNLTNPEIPCAVPKVKSITPPPKNTIGNADLVTPVGKVDSCTSDSKVNLNLSNLVDDSILAFPKFSSTVKIEELNPVLNATIDHDTNTINVPDIYVKADSMNTNDDSNNATTKVLIDQPECDAVRCSLTASIENMSLESPRADNLISQPKRSMRTSSECSYSMLSPMIKSEEYSPNLSFIINSQEDTDNEVFVKPNDHSTSLPSTPLKNIHTASTRNNFSTPDLVEKSIMSYNKMRCGISYLCTPKVPTGNMVQMTPGAKFNHKKILSRKVQEQLMLLHKNSEQNL